jgi:pSer/pThr/pTyr-binding forkhead associated (FHA) protein
VSVVLKISHQNQEQEVKITEPQTIGRSVKADIQIKDEGLSSLHGKFKLEDDGKLYYEDLGSKNGSSLNGTGVYASQFMLGDILKVGSLEISIDTPSLTTSERNNIGRRVQRARRQKDITFFKKKDES